MIYDFAIKEFRYLCSNLAILYEEHSVKLERFSKCVSLFLSIGDESLESAETARDAFIEKLISHAPISRASKKILHEGSILTLPGESIEKTPISLQDRDLLGETNYKSKAFFETLNELMEKEEDVSKKQAFKRLSFIIGSVFNFKRSDYSHLSITDREVDHGSVVQRLSEAFFGKIENPTTVKNGSIILDPDNIQIHPLVHIIKNKAYWLTTQADEFYFRRQREEAEEKYKKTFSKLSKLSEARAKAEEKFESTLKDSAERKELWVKINRDFEELKNKDDLTDAELSSKMKSLDTNMEFQKFLTMDFRGIQEEEYAEILSFLKSTLNLIESKHTPLDQEAVRKAELVSEISVAELAELIELHRKQQDSIVKGELRVISPIALSRNRNEIFDEIATGTRFIVKRKSDKVAVLVPYGIESPSDDLSQEERDKLHLVEEFSVDELGKVVDFVRGKVTVVDILNAK